MINCKIFKKNSIDMLMDPTEKWKFVNILSLLFITMTFAYDICLFFISFPDKNRDIIVGVANIINSGGLITILNYFFGSSKSSDGKDKVITSLINNQTNGDSSQNGGAGSIVVTPTNPSTVEIKTTPKTDADEEIVAITTTTTIKPA